ncbi:histidinol phosphate aminotransferase [Lutimaribacter marinistellae]|uniref:Histidinol phosphate aminotransferase n=1 Tax=Lutimaribacter marinistellae TaxID=1820329 RepID=A0ABV7TL24_9RHOB
MDNNRLRSAPDYTRAALTMLGVNLMWIFFVLWVIFGFLPVLLLAAFINQVINRLEARYSA